MESGCIWGSTGTDFLYKNDIPPPRYVSSLASHRYDIYFGNIFIETVFNGIEWNGNGSEVEIQFTMQNAKLNTGFVHRRSIYRMNWNWRKKKLKTLSSSVQNMAAKEKARPNWYETGKNKNSSWNKTNISNLINRFLFVCCYNGS